MRCAGWSLAILAGCASLASAEDDPLIGPRAPALFPKGEEGCLVAGLDDRSLRLDAEMGSDCALTSGSG